MRLSIPYRQHPFPSAYGATTARANFCEEDFVITGWVGEFANTLSNIAYVIYAIQGLRRQPKHSSLAAQSLHYGLAAVGVCSGLFHGLLKYHAQMSDDASMIVATACVFQKAMTFQRSPAFIRRFTTVLLIVVAIETAYHSIKDEQMIHELSFLTLIILVAVKTRSLIVSRVHRREDAQMLTRLAIFGAACFVTGYTLWQLDTIYCSELTAIKRSLGMPWSFLFEFHGWWHILTAVGAHIFMVMMDNLTREEVEFEGGPYKWLGGWSGPYTKED